MAAEWQRRCIRAEETLEATFPAISKASAQAEGKAEEARACRLLVREVGEHVRRLAARLARTEAALAAVTQGFGKGLGIRV